MRASKASGEGHTDIAALSAGVTAVVVSLFVTPGEYTVMNLVVCLTLVVIIFAYVWDGERARLQSLAVAFAIALALMPIVGYVSEAAQSESPGAVLIGTYEWQCGLDPCKDTGEHVSRVPNFHLALGWLLMAAVFLAADRVSQRRRRKRTPPSEV